MINEKKIVMFENCLGVEGLKMCNSLSFAHEETRNYLNYSDQNGFANSWCVMK